MHLKSLRLQNFRSYADSTIDFAPLTIVRGSNSVGKSSIEKAIELALAAHTDETTSDGKGSAALIRGGQTKALVELEFNENSADHSLKMALNGSARAVVTQDDPKYLDDLGAHKAVFSCLCNNRFFVELSEDKQKDILSAIILPKTYEWPAAIKDSATTCGLLVNWSKTPFDVIEDAYKAAFDARRDVNRDIKQFRMPEGDVSAAVQLKAIKERLATRNGELEDLVRKDAEATESARGNAAQLSAARTRLSEAQGRIQREQESTRTAEKAQLSAAALKKAKETAKEAQRAKEIDEARVKLEGQIADQKAALKALNELSKQAECPTCHQALAEKHVAAATQAIMDRRAELESLLQGNIATRKQLGNPDEAKAQVAAHERAAGDIDRSRGRIKDDEKIIKDAEKAVADLEGKTSRTVNDDAITELKGKIAKGNEALAKARAAEDLQGRIAKAKEEQLSLQKRQSELEKLVAYFGEEIRNELLADSIAPFEQSMNAVLEAWGYECGLSIEPYSFTLAFQNGSLPLKCLSKSQRYRFAAAFQVALAAVTGFRFVIIDEADIYTAKEKAALNKALLTAIANGTLEQAIVLGSDERTEVPNIPNAAFYMLKDIAAPGEIPTTQVERLGA